MKKLYFLDENMNLVLAPEVKWSDNTKFTVQNNIANTDYIMGLSVGNNVKYNLNISPLLKYVDPNGVNSAGNGSDLFPYQTISYALSQITDASVTKQYNLLFTGIINDSGTIYIKEDISINGLTQLIINNSNPIVFDPSWNSTSGNDYAQFYNLEITGQFHADFSSFTGKNAEIFLLNDSITTPLVINGNSSNGLFV